MFTGLVSATGSVAELELDTTQGTFRFAAGDMNMDGVKLGDSIAVSGVCLTLVRSTPDELGFDVVEETWRRTALGECGPGSEMNLERSLRVGDRFGGHYVTGHVDATGRIYVAWSERGRVSQ